MNYDEELDFASGGDSGENDATSIQPMGGSEVYFADNIKRAPENLRRRTEALRTAVQLLNYLADYDRAVLLGSTGTFTLLMPVGGEYRLNSSADLWIYPALSPGLHSGGRALGARLFVGGNAYAGTLGVNDVALVAASTYTGMRGYRDGSALSEAGTLSIGANGTTVAFVATGTPGAVTATVTGTPARHVTVSFGSDKTVQNVVDFINGDATSQGSYGLKHLLRASTTAGAGTPPTFTATKLQGGYDAEAHVVEPSVFAAFFGTTANRLQNGEGLAIAYTAGDVEHGGLGGRRQSLFDAPTDKVGGNTDNTYVALGNLFNTGREPEKIPGSIPIGKMIDGTFVFVDGTRLTVDTGAAHLGENAAILARFGGATGAASVGYSHSPAWHADAGGGGIDADNVEAALDEVVTDLKSTTIGIAGARCIGDEALPGEVSGDNTPRDILAGSLWHQLQEVLNGDPDSGAAGGGLNYRVNEWGHDLRGPRPLLKDMRDEGSTGGSATIRGVLVSAGNNALEAATAVPNTVLEVLQPFQYDNGAGQTCALAESCAYGGSPSYIVLTGASIAARFFTLATQLPLLARTQKHVQTGAVNFTTPLVVVELKGVTAGVSGDGNGYYYAVACDTTTYKLVLVRKDFTAPDFSDATFTSATVSFFSTTLIGNDTIAERIRAWHAGNAAFMAVGVSNPNAPVLEVHTPDAGTPTNPTKRNMVIYPDKLVAKDVQVGGTYATRDTDNILVSADKAALCGNELAALASPLPMPNATSLGSHHHGEWYTRTVFWSTPHALTLPHAALHDISIGTDYTVNADLTEMDAAWVKKAVILNVKLTLVSTTAVVQGTRINIDLSFRNPDYATNNNWVSVREDYYKVLDNTNAETRVITRQLIVPVRFNTPNYEFIYRALAGSMLAAGSQLDVYEVGAILGFA